MDPQTSKLKSLQIDMLKDVSGLLKIASSMDDDNAAKINRLVNELDALTISIEGGSNDGSPRQPPRGAPNLTIV